MSDGRRNRRTRQGGGHNKGNENEFGKNVVILANRQPRENPKDEERVVESVRQHSDLSPCPLLLKNQKTSQKSLPPQAKSAIKKVVNGFIRNNGSEERDGTRPAAAGRNENGDMGQRAKFLNKYGDLKEDFLQFLSDDASFKVIGIIGLQGSGKSTILNTLAGRTVFPVEKPGDVESCRHCTVGVDAYITPDRTILLDMQPILSLSVMDTLVQFENRSFTVAIDYNQSFESQIMIESLQTACFLLSICHTILVTFDCFLDRDLAQFLQSAEMLKPTTPKTATTNVLDDEINDYFPHVVFVKTKCDFVAAKERDLLSEELTKVFKDSMLLHQDGVANSFARQVISDDAVNIFQIPEKDSINYESVCREFLAKIMSMSQEEFVEMPHGSFTERNWFQYSARIWDEIKKSSTFQEYKKLLV